MWVYVGLCGPMWTDVACVADLTCVTCVADVGCVVKTFEEVVVRFEVEK